jgi:hypothetical protein
MIDESTARLFQERYIGGDRRALSGLYAELRAFAYIAIKSYARKRKVHYEDIDDVAHSAAAKISERYLKGDYYIKHFYTMVRRECLHILTEGARAKGSTTVVANLPDPPEDQSFYIADIVASALYGTRAVIDLFYSRSWSGALRAIAKYATEQWMVNQMCRMHYVYRLTHGEEGSHGITGRRGMGGDKAAVRSVRSEVLSRGQHHAENLVQGKG